MFKLSKFGFISDCKTKYKNKQGEYVSYKWYKAWINMIHRCYNPKNKSYKYYGAKGVYVSDELKIASVFRDWYNENNPNGDLVMDKDISHSNIYSKETIIFISNTDNIKEMRNRYKLLGISNPRLRHYTYYETHSEFRFNFKSYCYRHGLIFENFKEIFDKRFICKNGKPRNKYFYVYSLIE